MFNNESDLERDCLWNVFTFLRDTVLQVMGGPERSTTSLWGSDRFLVPAFQWSLKKTKARLCSWSPTRMCRDIIPATMLFQVSETSNSGTGQGSDTESQNHLKTRLTEPCKTNNAAITKVENNIEKHSCQAFHGCITCNFCHNNYLIQHIQSCPDPPNCREFHYWRPYKDHRLDVSQLEASAGKKTTIWRWSTFTLSFIPLF